jgi:transposase
MLQRHAISDADWDRIKDLLPGRPGQTGWLAQDNRRFVDAILYVAKTGIPWRDLPERFGPWNSVWRRFDRWCRKGTWQRVFAVLQDPDLEWLILDSTVVRAHACAAGAKKKSDGSGGQAEQALGRSRGGFGTKIHVAVNGLGLPVTLHLRTSGRCHTSRHATGGRDCG